MFECFSIPIWVHCKPGNATINLKLCHYIPSPESIACALLEAKTPRNDTWGQDVDVWGTPAADTHNETAIGWDDPMQGQTASGGGPHLKLLKLTFAFRLLNDSVVRSQEKIGRLSLHGISKKTRRKRKRNLQPIGNHTRVGNEQ
jgi:hypothetical protein